MAKEFRNSSTLAIECDHYYQDDASETPIADQDQTQYNLCVEWDSLAEKTYQQWQDSGALVDHEKYLMVCEVWAFYADAFPEHMHDVQDAVFCKRNDL